MRSGQLPRTFISLLPGYEAIPNFVLADPTYPLTPFCMKEYQTCTTNKEVIFNNMLRSARNQVECALGRLKARWRILTRKIDHKSEAIPALVYSCFVLHNYCERKSNCINEDELRAQCLRDTFNRTCLTTAECHKSKRQRECRLKCSLYLL